jgi:hypothetical protein
MLIARYNSHAASSANGLKGLRLMTTYPRVASKGLFHTVMEDRRGNRVWRSIHLQMGRVAIATGLLLLGWTALTENGQETGSTVISRPTGTAKAKPEVTLPPVNRTVQPLLTR